MFPSGLCMFRILLVEYLRGFSILNTLSGKKLIDREKERKVMNMQTATR